MQHLEIILLLTALVATYPTPAVAAQSKASNGCTVSSTSTGQWVTHNTGTAGTVTIHVNGKGTFTIPRLNQPFKATSDKKARVGGYDKNGKVC